MSLKQHTRSGLRHFRVHDDLLDDVFGNSAVQNELGHLSNFSESVELAHRQCAPLRTSAPAPAEFASQLKQFIPSPAEQWRQ